MNVKIVNRFPDWDKLSKDLKSYYNIYRKSNVIVHDILNSNYVPVHDTTLTVKYAFGGDEYYLTNRCRFRVNEDNFLVINEKHCYESYIESENKVESLAVFFKPGFADEAHESLNVKPGNLAEPFEKNGIHKDIHFFEKLYSKDDQVVPILINIRNSIKSNNSSSGYIEELIVILMEELFFLKSNQIIEIEKLRYVKRSTREEIFKRLNVARDFISSSYNENINLDNIANAACLNGHYLLREFKKYFKTTPHRYLTSVRLTEAKKLLKNSSKSVTEISSIVGFEFVSSFTKLFNRHFKITPSEYRNLNIPKSQL